MVVTLILIVASIAMPVYRTAVLRARKAELARRDGQNVPFSAPTPPPYTPFRGERPVSKFPRPLTVENAFHSVDDFSEVIEESRLCN